MSAFVCSNTRLSGVRSLTVVALNSVTPLKEVLSPEDLTHLSPEDLTHLSEPARLWLLGEVKTGAIDVGGALAMAKKGGTDGIGAVIYG
jgi:hypothetical protein